MNFALTAWDRDILPPFIARYFPVEIALFIYLHSPVDARKLKQQLQQNDIPKEVLRSVDALKQETGVHFHP